MVKKEAMVEEESSESGEEIDSEELFDGLESMQDE